VVEPTYKECKEFLDNYHFQGNVTSKVRVGLKYKDELVALTVFSKPRYNPEYDWEIGRYAIKANCNVCGNFSKMIQYFIEKYNPKSILTYHDLLFGNNSVYEKNGFTKLVDSDCGFYWYRDNKIYNRRGWWKGIQSKKLEKFDPALSAHDNMRANSYVKIFELGQGKYEWQPSSAVPA